MRRTPRTEFTDARSAAYGYWRQRYATGMPHGPAPQTGLMSDAYHGGQRSSVHAMYDPIIWPDEGYPCQLCWAVGRWPWEPMRSCPWDVDPESTYCEKHGGKAKKAPKAGAEPTFVAWDETTANLSSPNWNGLANVVAVVGAATGRFRLVDITEA